MDKLSINNLLFPKRETVPGVQLPFFPQDSIEDEVEVRLHWRWSNR